MVKRDQHVHLRFGAADPLIRNIQLIVRVAALYERGIFAVAEHVRLRCLGHRFLDLPSRARSFKESINASTTYSVWPLVEANTMCRRNPLLVKFGTRPPGLSIRYPLRLTSSSPRFLPPLWRACPKTHIRWAEARAQASHRKARVAPDRATPQAGSDQNLWGVQFHPVHKLRGS